MTDMIRLSDRDVTALEQIEKDTDRDNFMTAEEARDYGLVDKIFYARNQEVKG